MNYLDNSTLPIKFVARYTDEESVCTNAVRARNLIGKRIATLFILTRGQHRGKLLQRKRTEEEKEKDRKMTETEVKLEVEIEEEKNLKTGDSRHLIILEKGWIESQKRTDGMRVKTILNRKDKTKKSWTDCLKSQRK